MLVEATDEDKERKKPSRWETKCVDNCLYPVWDEQTVFSVNRADHPIAPVTRAKFVCFFGEVANYCRTISNANPCICLL